MKTDGKVPRDAVLFAAGIRSVTGPVRTFEQIARALSLLGWEDVDPADLEAAVGDWGVERIEMLTKSKRVLVVRKEPTGGYTQ